VWYMVIATSIWVLVLVMSFGYVEHPTALSLLSGHLVSVSGICLHFLPVPLDCISSLPASGCEFVGSCSALYLHPLSADPGFLPATPETLFVDCHIELKRSIGIL